MHIDAITSTNLNKIISYAALNSELVFILKEDQNLELYKKSEKNKILHSEVKFICLDEIYQQIYILTNNELKRCSTNG